MKKVIGKKVLILLFLLLFLPLFSGCFLAPMNHAPVITSTPITAATVGEPYIYDVEANDPDGDSLKCSLTTCPRCMTIDCDTGVINWIPTSIRNKSHDVTVKVSDGELYDTQSFSITVSEAPSINLPTLSNDAPVITSTPITSLLVDGLYTYDVEATDSDNDILTYSLKTNPTGMTIDSVTGEISWAPISSQIGDNDVTVEVSDGEKSTSQSFIITVYDILKSINVLPDTMTLFAGESCILTSITASYNYGPDKPLALVDCSYSSNNETVATVATGVVTGVADGSATITISYEENGITKTDTVAVTVNPSVLTSITVLPDTMSLFVGQNISVDSITASYNYGSDKTLILADCSYSSNNETVATVATGVVTGVADGSATITISYEENGITKTDTVAVTVNPSVLIAITVEPDTMSLFVGEGCILTSITASYNYGPDNPLTLADCSYSCNIGGIASVCDGVVIGLAEGPDTITASYTEGTITKTDTVEVMVNSIGLDSITLLPDTMSLFVGQNISVDSITASYNYGSDKTLILADCSYSSNNETVATVATGVVTGVADGSATITISYEENGITKTDTVAVTVNPSVLIAITVEPDTMSLFVGEGCILTSITASYNYGPDNPLTLADCSYSSNNETVATVATGVVTGEAQGSVTITVSYTEGTIPKEDTVDVTVNPIPPNLELLPHTQKAKIGESFSINVEVENVTDLLGASITLNFNHVAMPFLSAKPGSFFSDAVVLPDLSGPHGSITLNLESLAGPVSGTGNIVIVSFIAVIKSNNYPITFGVTELKDKDNQIIVHTTGSGCKVHIKK